MFLASSTPLLHLLTPSAESLRDPNIDNKEKQLKVFNSIHKAMNVSSQLNREQNKMIQHNLAENQAITAIFALKTMIEAFTANNGQPYPSVAYQLADYIVVQIIRAGMIEQNLPRHTQLDQMRQIFAYSPFQSQNGQTCSSLKFHGVANYIVPDLQLLRNYWSTWTHA